MFDAATHARRLIGYLPPGRLFRNLSERFQAFFQALGEAFADLEEQLDELMKEADPATASSLTLDLHRDSAMNPEELTEDHPSLSIAAAIAAKKGREYPVPSRQFFIDWALSEYGVAIDIVERGTLTLRVGCSVGDLLITRGSFFVWYVDVSYYDQDNPNIPRMMEALRRLAPAWTMVLPYSEFVENPEEF